MPSKRSLSNKTTINNKGSISPLNQNKTVEPVNNALNPINEVKIENYELETDTYPFSVQLFLIVFGLLINFFILDWLIKVNNINKCQCANINEGYLLKEWFMFLIGYQIFVALILIINGSIAILMPLSIIMSIILYAISNDILLHTNK